MFSTLPDCILDREMQFESRHRIDFTVLSLDGMNAALSHHPVHKGCQGKSTVEHISALAEAITGILRVGSNTLGRVE